MIEAATELQKFKISANAFLLGVDGLQSALCPSVFKRTNRGASTPYFKNFCPCPRPCPWRCLCSTVYVVHLVCTHDNS